jgi:hypothetical protein
MNNRVKLLLVAIPIILASCSKKALPPIIPFTPISSSTVAIEEIDFDYLHGKARMILKDGNKEREVKANIRVRKDSVIWMNFTVIGVQGGRALINKDSITIISNVDKEYYVFEYEELSKRFNFEINYQMIQSAMLGNLLMARSESDSAEYKSATHLLKQSSGNVELLNYISVATRKIQKVEMKEMDTHNSLIINYGDFQPVGNRLFPYNGNISLFYKTAAGLLNTTIVFEYTKAEVGDKELKFPFNIPKKYDRR